MNEPRKLFAGPLRGAAGNGGNGRREPGASGSALLEPGAEEEDNPSPNAPAVMLLDQLLRAAVEQRASDIHIEPHERDLFLRFRSDGVLFDWRRLDPAQHAPLVSRVKVLAGMDIAERRLPLDGRFSIELGGRRWDVRVSTVPGIFGEKAVLRLLPKDHAGLMLEDLGMRERQRQIFEGLLARPYGMLLVTGPTGAGKTTTLYAALRQMDCLGRNVLTIEDPVEYELPRVTQIQVHAKIGLSFAAGLRHILRQDPDILMVGEIRDAETLEMAVQAALTGHLVFSTLHCNDAAGAAPRALDMGLEPFLFTSAVTGVVAQRLVRRVCPDCRAEEPFPPALRERFGIADASARTVRGRAARGAGTPATGAGSPSSRYSCSAMRSSRPFMPAPPPARSGRSPSRRA